jgi:hypothetical protein
MRRDVAVEVVDEGDDDDGLDASAGEIASSAKLAASACKASRCAGAAVNTSS